MRKMTSQEQRDFIYSLIYIALAVATFKHTSWSFSTVMEGPEPVVDWVKFNLDFAGLWAIGGLLFWYVWGALCAIAVDVGFYLTAKSIRESQNTSLVGMWLTYTMVALISAYCQVMYSVQHAAQFVAVEGVPAWVNVMYTWSFIILPVSLPGMSIGYTLFTKMHDKENAPKLGRLDETGMKYLTVDEASTYTGYSTASIRQWAAQGKIGIKAADEAGRVKWKFTMEELAKFKKD